MMIKYAKISDFKIKKAEDYEEATDSAEPVLKLYDDDGEVLATTPDWFWLCTRFKAHGLC